MVSVLVVVEVLERVNDVPVEKRDAFWTLGGVGGGEGVWAAVHRYRC